MPKYGGIFDPENLTAKLKTLELTTLAPDFWQDQEKAKAALSEIEKLKDPLNKYENLAKEIEYLASLIDLALAERDESLTKEIDQKIKIIQKDIQEFELVLKLSGPYDKENCILAINAGAGGTDAQDWADMLLRMYLRFCEKQGWQTEATDISPGEEAGIKSATIMIKGLYAYGYLKSERGVHRLVRLSPFNANNKRQTSFASVEIIPEIPLPKDIEINPEDLKIETCRASGAGGQHINKTDSAVRIMHLPTNIVVKCQSGRSQVQNKETALRILYAKLKQLQLEQHKEKISELKGEQKEIAWGNQIRSYVFHPYTLVKDHRLEVETGDVQSVMDGDIMKFIEAFLLQNKEIIA